ncbi:MAG: tripartite tricarboxylate transporter substrate binding protein [Pseudomonadota bacterium]
MFSNPLSHASRAAALCTALACGLAGLAGLLAAPAARAQAAFPSKAIRIVVPVPPGGGSDAIARVLAERMTASLQQPVLVDNKPGGGTLIGSDLVAKSAPDGYTLLMINNAFVINPWFYKLPYDTIKDFAPITILATSPNVLVAHPSFPPNNTKELIAYAKARPDQVPVAVSAGQMSQLGSALLEQAAGIDLQLIPYKGSGAGNIDLLAGTVMMSFGTAPTYVQQIKAGKLKALGVGGTLPLASLPGVPPIAETLPGFEANTWFGLFAPAGTPPAVVERLRKEVIAALGSPAVGKRLVDDGYIPGEGLTPAQFTAQIQREMAQWEGVIRKGNIKGE